MVNYNILVLYNPIDVILREIFVNI